MSENNTQEYTVMSAADFLGEKENKPEPATLEFDGTSAVKVDVVEAAQELNPVVGAVSKLSFSTATAVGDMQQAATKVAAKVVETKNRTAAFASTVSGAAATLVGKEVKDKVAPPLAKEKIKVDPTFDIANNQFNIVLPLRYYQPATVGTAELVPAVSVKRRHRAACVLWLMAANKIPRMHQAERYMFGVVSSLMKMKYIKENDIFVLPRPKNLTISERLSSALNEIELNFDDGVTGRVYELLQPLISLEETDLIMRGELSRLKPAVIFEPERCNAVKATLVKQRFVSVCGRTEVGTVTLTDNVTRKELLLNKRIAPEDALANTAMCGMLSMCDLVMLLTMTSTAIRQTSTIYGEAYQAFDAELGRLYIEGAQGGLTALLTLASKVTPADGQLNYEFCSSIRHSCGILYGMLMFLGNRKLLSKIFYYFCRT